MNLKTQSDRKNSASARRATLTLQAIFLAALLAGITLAAYSADPTTPPAPSEPSPRVSVDRTGEVRTQDGQTLHLTADLGSVHITELEPGAAPVVRYAVHIETDARQPIGEKLLEKYVLTARETPSGVEISGTSPAQAGRGGSNAQFYVQFEVSVPALYSVDVNTGVGDIVTQDIGGIANLVTQGGNIRTGRIGYIGWRNGPQGHPAAHLYTEGGHIQFQDVAGDVDAFTAGGHIVAGNISGDAVLRSGGGHIRAGQIGGRARLETDGGNITLKQAGSFVSVRTGGGQIDFGEVRGSVRAQTGGGGIRVITVSGPMEVESNGGSICLTRVAGTVQAATGGGNIQAWINPDASESGGTVSLPGASQLSAGSGDIVVFLPRNLAVTIDALVEDGARGKIEADPSLSLNVQPVSNRSDGPVRAITLLNGGGEVLKLRTTVGKIRLRYLDADTALRESLIREQRQRINQWREADLLPVSTLGPPTEEMPAFDEKSDWLEGWMDKLEIAFLGGLREDPSDLFKRLKASPHPLYPDLARRAGIEGIVRLQVRVKADGTFEVLKVMEGEPVLADAAMDAVRRWRARPISINGTKVETISTITFNFELRR